MKPFPAGPKTALIDGYNVIRCHAPWRSVFATDMARARELLQSYCAEWRARRKDVDAVSVVFDGSSSVVGPSPQPPAGVRVTFTRSGEEADNRIRRRIASAADPRALLVVSDDREITRFAQAQGAEILSVQDFVKRPRLAQRSASESGDKRPLSQQARQEIDAELRRVLGIRDGDE